jgi:hypothetical protein
LDTAHRVTSAPNVVLRVPGRVLLGKYNAVPFRLGSERRPLFLPLLRSPATTGPRSSAGAGTRPGSGTTDCPRAADCARARVARGLRTRRGRRRRCRGGGRRHWLPDLPWGAYDPFTIPTTLAHHSAQPGGTLRRWARISQ